MFLHAHESGDEHRAHLLRLVCRHEIHRYDRLDAESWNRGCPTTCGETQVREDFHEDGPKRPKPSGVPPV